MRGDLKFNPPPGVSFRSHGLFALRERTIVKRPTFASFFSLRSFSERGKKERARDQFKEISKRGDHFQKGNRKSASSMCSLFRSFVSVRGKKEREREEEEPLCFRVFRSLRDESGVQPSSSSSSSETTRLLTAFFPKNFAKRRENRPKIKTYRALSW